jgi:hypothetical protein
LLTAQRFLGATRCSKNPAKAARRRAASALPTQIPSQIKDVADVVMKLKTASAVSAKPYCFFKVKT